MTMQPLPLGSPADTSPTRPPRWIVVADSPFLPAHGGGEREHLGFVRAAARSGRLALLVVPGAADGDIPAYQDELGDVPVVVTARRTTPLMLLHPTKPYVVASRPAPRWLAARAAALAPDATGVVVFSYKSRALGEALSRRLDLPAVIRQHNREGAYHRSLAAGTPGPRGWALTWEALRIEHDERRLGRADWITGTADISLADAQWRRSTGAHRVVHVPPFASVPAAQRAAGETAAPGETGAPAETGAPGEAGPPRVLFLGALDIATNTDAVSWFLDTVWPQVLARHATVVLDVVGRRPSAAFRDAVAAYPRVRLEADVPDVAPYLARAAVAVNPAVSGSGVNIKLIEYLDAGIPLVSTSLATRGLPLAPGDDLEIQDSGSGFADAVLRLLEHPDAARAMALRGQAHLRELLDPAANLARIDGLLAR
ncbi:MAG TPA: glycosyltransferase family 4 protein [Kineosporiaceae bacterium]